MDADWEAMGARYAVYQEEMGENGTRHLQGYIEMNEPVRFSHFNEWLGGAHFEKAKGTSQQCTDYCTKEDTRIGGPYVFGQPNVKQGTRSDIIGLRDAIKSGKRGRDLYDDDRLVVPAVKYGRGVGELISAYTTPVSRDDVSVTLHFGPAGTGKTHCCYSADAYLYDGNANGFWNGYADQRKVCGGTFFILMGIYYCNHLDNHQGTSYIDVTCSKHQLGMGIDF